MTNPRLKLCCTDGERRFVKRLAAMPDPALIKLTDSLKGRRHTGKRWWITERRYMMAALELLDRGYSKVERWEKPKEKK